MKKPRETQPRDDRYMGLAFIHASFSKDPNTQMGSVIVSQDNRILGTGYNGPPSNFNDNAINWERPDKYDYIIHAEENAIDYSTESLVGATLYVTGKPCNKCMLKIGKHKIKRVLYYNHKPTDPSSMFATDLEFKKTEEIAKAGGVFLMEYKGNLNWMRDYLKVLESVGIFV